MVKVIAHNFIKKEFIEKVMPMYNELVEETRKENGCIAYDLFKDDKDETHFVFVEEWETMPHLEAHFKTPHFVKYIPQIGEMAEKQGDVQTLTRVF